MQLSILLRNEGSSMPLWLHVACEELRVHGDFRTLSHKIETLPGVLSDLLAAIINRLIKEDETNLMHKVWKFK